MYHWGIDIGITRHSAAAVAVGISEFADGGKPIYNVVYCREWVPEKRAESKKPTVDPGEVAALILRAHAKGYVSRVGYDRYQFAQAALELQRAGIRCQEVSSQADKYRGDLALWDALREKRIRHNGNRAMTRHISSATVQESAKGLSIVGSKVQQHHSDLVAALSSAVLMAESSRGQFVPIKVQHNPLFDGPYPRDDSVRSEVILRKGMTTAGDVYLDPNPSNPEHISFVECPRRTRGCPDCRAQLNAIGWWDMSDEQRDKVWKAEKERVRKIRYERNSSK